MKQQRINLLAAAMFGSSLAVSGAYADDAGQSLQQQEIQSGTRVGQRDPLDSGGLRPLQLNRGQVTSGTAFNPAISVILDGVYVNESREIESPAGFEGGHGHGHDHGHGHGGLEEGFSLRETEITLSASVDKYFDAIAVLAIEGDSGVEVEEAYFVTRSLPAGLQLKGGKFLSDIGYINRQHPHDYDFVDRPLMSEFLFGEHGLQETGLQLSWVAPTSFYSRMGVEILEGSNSGVANYIGEGVHRSDTIVEAPGGAPQRLRFDGDKPFEEKSGPRLFTAFAKVAPNLGYNHAAQFGVSYGQATTYQQEETHSSLRLETWDGDAWFAGVDAVYKYDAGRQFGHGNWTLQAEYFYREIDVDYMSQSFDNNKDLVPTNGGGVPDVFSGTAKQDGAYMQVVYGFAPRWNVGLRAEGVGFKNDSLEADRSNNRFESFDTSYRYTGQISFMPTEFSRIRAQLTNSDFVDEDGDSHDNWTFILQYQMSLGVHGAHAF